MTREERIAQLKVGLNRYHPLLGDLVLDQEIFKGSPVATSELQRASLEVLIGGFFSWAGTAQGHSFWNTVRQVIGEHMAGREDITKTQETLRQLFENSGIVPMIETNETLLL